MKNYVFGLKMKCPKLLVFLSAILMLSCLVLAAAAYSNSNTYSDGVSQSPELQIFSPRENATYTRTNVPLNISGMNEVAQITYSLDGDENITLCTDQTPSLTNGAHNLTVYSYDREGNVVDSQTVSFNVSIPYPPTRMLTMLQVQETINYFEDIGLKVQVLDTSKPQTCLYAESIDVESKEDLANITIAKGINVIYEVSELNANYVAFCANYYNNSPLPTVYTYSATLQ